VINEGGDVRSQEDYVRINKLNRGKRAMLMELPDEGENLIPVPYFSFNVDEVG